MTEIVAQIDLLRHGETETSGRFCGSTDTPLSKTGWQQMWQRIEQTHVPWQHIITSPLSRCASFAHSLAQHRNIPVTADARLQEMHFGKWENCKVADLISRENGDVERFWRNPLEHPPPESEHLPDFNTRVLTAWQDILDEHITPNSQHLLLVTHGGVIRALLCHLHNTLLERIMEFDVPHAMMQSVQVERQDGTYRAYIATHSAQS